MTRAPEQPTVPATEPFGGRRNELLVIVGLGLLAFILRLIYVLGLRESPFFETPIMDAAYHLEWARALASGEDFLPGPFFRAPLYPWFLALTQWWFDESLLAPRILQCLFGGASAVLAYLLGRRAFDARAGLLAGLFAATYWVLIYFDAELLIPTLIVPLNLGALYLTLGLRDRATPARAALAGVVFGLSAIARPNVLMFMPLLALWLLFRSPPGMRRLAWMHRLRPGLPAALGFSAGLLLPILPVTAYNYCVGDDTVLISSQAGVNFWIGNNPDSDGSAAIVPGTRSGWWEGYHDAIALAQQAEGRPLKPSEVSAHYSRKTWSWIAEHPGDAVDLLLWKTRLFFTSYELGNNQEVRFFARHYNPFVAWLPVRLWFLFGFGLLGLLLALRHPARTFPLTGFCLVYSASVIAFFICSRFRVPVLPLLMLFSAHACCWLFDRLRAKNWLRLLSGLALALVVSFLTTRLPAAIITTDDNGYMQIAAALMEAGRLEEAEQNFQRAVELNPRNRYAPVGLSSCLLALGRPGEAEQTLVQLLAIWPFLPEGVEALLRLRIDTNRLAAADGLAQAAERYDPDLPQLAYQLGRLRAAEGRLDEALVYFRKAVRREPEGFNTNFSLAMILANSPTPDQAIPYFEQALRRATERDRKFADSARASLIRLYRMTGQEPKARELEQP